MKGVLHCVSFALCEFPPDRIGHIWPSLLTVWLLWQLNRRARNHKRGLLNEEQTGNCHLLCSILYLGTASPQTRPKLPGPDLNLIWADAAAKCLQTQVTDQSPICTHCTVYTFWSIDTIYIVYIILKIPGSYSSCVPKLYQYTPGNVSSSVIAFGSTTSADLGFLWWNTTYCLQYIQLLYCSQII